MRTAVPTLLIAMVLAAGCGSGDSEPTSGPTASPEQTPSAAASPQPESATPTATSPAVTESSDSGPHPVFGLEPVTLRAAESGGGNRPLLEWEPVDGAFMYSAVLLTPSGEAYWAWEGQATSIHVGGEPQLNETASGPSVVAGMTWTVAAYDDEFHAIALSEPRSISP